MNFQDIFKKSFIEGFTGSDISTTKIVVTLFVTCVFALYIFAMYRFVTRKTFYSKTFNIAIAVISIITAGIILAMQSSLVISLGMVGALSIVRFRTAIKDPLDLIFLFWSISIGIICGAGLFEVALFMSFLVTIALLGLDLLPVAKAAMILVINCEDKAIEEQIISTVKQNTKLYKVKSRNISNQSLDMVIEIKTKNEGQLINEVSNLDKVMLVSLLSHDGEVTF
ncbi:DUF4956 domain-containing protein [Candidatus Galacturonibacter soehngenii]|uniref:DUF4956 domain-containing protein n=1 Tax=Candidatus Galacturonatibacter soehngenii TaxID=2307010 RepID=A0A7V7QKJ7_9FIRM|nr:DUF4956 domain-containing protein [Candidatus Galacturonibacter soehngenii]KAB1438216.1 DUF4956 domain-containing protein [Candidatus Galacturonibacter soehngenii]